MRLPDTEGQTGDGNQLDIVVLNKQRKIDIMMDIAVPSSRLYIVYPAINCVWYGLLRYDGVPSFTFRHGLILS